MSNATIEAPVELKQEVLEVQFEAKEASVVSAPQSSVQNDDLNTPMIALVGFVSAILTFVAIFGLQAMYNQYSQSLHESKVVDVRLEEADRALEQQRAKLGSYDWVDRSQGLVSVPIQEAMDIVVNEMK